MEGMSKDCSLRYQKEFDLGLKVEWKVELSLRCGTISGVGGGTISGLQDLGQKVELSLGQRAETFQRFFISLCRMWDCL